jgi:peptide deformylase
MATILQIITAPADVLSHATVDVAPNKVASHAAFVADMGVTMEQADGIGLAAVQVNSTVRVAVIHRDVAGTPEHLVLFNPHITWHSWRAITDEEGCLSVPGVFGNVRRPSSVECSYVTLAGESKTLKARGLFARVIQHEVDHLDGVLFVDRAESIVDGADKLQAWHRIP